VNNQTYTVQSQSNGQGSSIYNPLSVTVGGAGFLASVAQYSAASSWSVGDNLGLYTSGWGGNQYVSTTNVGELAGRAGIGLAVGSIAIDAYGLSQGNISTAHFTTNTAMTGIGFLGVPGAVAAGSYFLLDTFYPSTNPKAGGAAALGRDMATFYSNPQNVETYLAPVGMPILLP
jgi:hypothetical protein